MATTSLGFLIVFVTGIIASVIVNGVWSFYVYELVYFANPKARWWGGSVPDLSYSFITVLTMMLCVVAKFKNYQQNSLVRLPLTKWFAALMAVYVVTLFSAVSYELHWTAMIDYAKLYIMLLLAYKLVDTQPKLTLALWMYIIGAAYIGWEAYSVGRNEFGRVEGIGPVDSPEANGVAAALVPAVPLLMYFVAKGDLKEKLLAAFLGIWIINGLVLINSRGAFLGVVAGAAYLLFYLLFSGRQSHKQRLVAVLIVFSGLAGGLSLTDDQFWNRMETLKEVEDESKSGSHRYRMWLSTFDLLDDHPAGVGAWGFQILSPDYVDPELFDHNKTTKAVHSIWFQVLSEIGWLGFVIFMGLVTSCFLAVRRARRALHANFGSPIYFLIVALEAGFISYLVAATFIDQFRAQILYWTILYIACAYNIHVLKVEDTASSGESVIHR